LTSSWIKSHQEADNSIEASITKAEKVISLGAWLVALGLLSVTLLLGWRVFSRRSVTANHRSPSSPLQTDFHSTPLLNQGSDLDELPTFEWDKQGGAILRRLDLHTIVPNRSRRDVTTYVVRAGDSVFGIAQKFNITPETVLWGNYDLLNDNPHLISIDMALQIPPVSGVLYTWQAGDEIKAVAERFEATAEDILSWPGNNFDLANPQIEPGAIVMIPGGQREFRQWLIPTIPRGSAGVSKSVYGQGACEGSYEGAIGSGAFIWPAGNHFLSGNDYWSGHLGIDIAAGTGSPIYASDSGVVVFAGWATGGYGNTVIVDHGNGYQTLYAHLNSVTVGCGYSLQQGAIIGYAGSTGNSTGTHLHFEVRYLGGFISPWFVLPAP
jgi:murein DD-endopeptidase MepM/ murein hydrolase activator NlpD